MALSLGARSARCLHAKLEKHAHSEWMRPVITQLGEQTILCVKKNMVLSAGDATHLPGTRFDMHPLGGMSPALSLLRAPPAEPQRTPCSGPGCSPWCLLTAGPYTENLGHACLAHKEEAS